MHVPENTNPLGRIHSTEQGIKNIIVRSNEEVEIYHTKARIYSRSSDESRKMV